MNECSVEKADRMGYQTMCMNLNPKAWRNDAVAPPGTSLLVKM